MNSYEEKQQARRERYEELAEAAEREAGRLGNRAHEMASAIPFGQPILVGHHSERGDRRYRARIGTTMDKAVAAGKKAEYYRQKAKAVGHAGISSDDPEAVQKLQAKLDKLTQLQERMKAVNRAIRKHGKAGQAAQVAALVEQGFTEDQAAQLLVPDSLGRVGMADYQLKNNNANIRRLRKRIEQLRKVASWEPMERECEGFTYREDPEENRVMFIFPGKPDEDTRSALKANAFKWSPARGAWVRKMTANGIGAGRRLMQQLA